jgi:RNA polymerase subunit RPABC4/transcription elongation factor Spt4
MPDLSQLEGILLYGSALAGAFLAALWLSLVIWTARDIRARSRDRGAQIFFTILVALLTLPGIIFYLLLRPRETLDEAYQRTLEEEALLSEIERRVLCPGCSTPAEREWQICPYCHTRLRKACPQCQHMLEIPWQVCPYCAHTFTARPGTATTSAGQEITPGEPTA